MSFKKKKVQSALDDLFSQPSKAQSETQTRRKPARRKAPAEAAGPPKTETTSSIEEVQVAPQSPITEEKVAGGSAPDSVEKDAAPATPAVADQPGQDEKIVEPQPEQADTNAGQGEFMQLVVFSLDGESFGLSIDRVESIIKLQDITIVPQAKPHVLGVTNLRGTVLPVIDLRKRFGLPQDDTLSDPRIVVLLVKDEKVGILVDAVSEVLRLPADAIEPPPPMVSNIDTAFLTGIAQQGDKLVLLLDLEQTLA